MCDGRWGDLVIFKYLKNGHMREEIIILCCSEGTRLVKGRGKQNLENSLRNIGHLSPNIAIILTLRMTKRRQVWFFVRLWGSNQDRNLNWVISRSIPIWRIYGLLMNTCYLKWGCLCIYSSTPPIYLCIIYSPVHPSILFWVALNLSELISLH